MLRIFGENLATEAALRQQLVAEIEAYGSAAGWAREHNLAQPSVQMAMTGKRGISPAIAKILGYEKVIRYAPTRS